MKPATKRLLCLAFYLFSSLCIFAQSYHVAGTSTYGVPTFGGIIKVWMLTVKDGQAFQQPPNKVTSDAYGELPFTFSAYEGAYYVTIPPSSGDGTLFFDKLTIDSEEVYYCQGEAAMLFEAGNIQLKGTNFLESVEPASTSSPATIVYQWQLSYDGINWVDIHNADEESYVPIPTNKTTYYRRSASTRSEISIAPVALIDLIIGGGIENPLPKAMSIQSNPITVGFYDAGTIGQNQTLHSHEQPQMLWEATPASIPTNFTYQWEKRELCASEWETMANSSTSTLNLEKLNVSTVFRRRILAQGWSECSNEVTIIVHFTDGGSIGAAQTLIAGSKPETLSSQSSPIGGDGCYTYQWEQSADGVSWQAVSGARSESYQPQVVTNTTYYRRRTISDGQVAYSNRVAISLQPTTAGQEGTILNTYVPNYQSISTAHAVGEIPMQFDVSSSGFATYVIPIDAVPGINGMQPSLALAYNSQGGIGAEGVGWSISGLSSISRMNATRYHNGEAAPVSLTSIDCFSLDDQRLVLSERKGNVVSYLPIMGEVRIDGYLADDGSTLTHFKVMYPNGQVGIYGFSEQQSSELSYPLTYLSDQHNNYVKFNYTKKNGIYHIADIQYGGAGSTVGFASLTFDYKERIDRYSSYVAGEKYELDLLLTRINIFAENTLLHSYLLSYDESEKRALLTEVGYTAGGESLHPIRFHYGSGTGAPSITSSKVSYTSGNLTEYSPVALTLIRGKMGARKSEDIVVAFKGYNPYKYTEQKAELFKKPKSYYRSEYPTDAKIDIYSLRDTQNGSSLNTILTGEDFVQFLVANLDGKPGDELIKINNSVVNGKDRLLFTVYNMYKDGSIVQDQQVFYDVREAHEDEDKNWSVYPKLFRSGDLDGDGRDELYIIATDQQSFSSHAHTSNPRASSDFGSTGEPSQAEQSGDVIRYSLDAYLVKLYGNNQGLTTIRSCINASHLNDLLFIVDYNGDGKGDILHHVRESKITRIYSLKDNVSANGDPAFELIEETSSLPLTPAYNSKRALLADLNADGKLDVLIPPSPTYTTTEIVGACCQNPTGGGQSVVYDDSGRPVESCYECGRAYNAGKEVTYHWEGGDVWEAYFSKGSGGFDEKRFSFKEWHKEDLSLHDVNNDGLPDLICQKEDQLTVYLNVRGEFDKVPAVTFTLPTQNSFLVPVDLTVKDDSNVRLLCFDNAQKGAIHKLKYTMDDGAELLLTASVNSMGVVRKIQYERLNNSPEYTATYQDEVPLPYPDYNYLGALPVVKRMEAYYMGEKLQSSNYRYQNAVVNLLGLGFRGFTTLEVTDELRNVSTLRKFDPFRYGVLLSEHTSGRASISNEYSISELDSRRVKISLNKSIQADLLNGTTTTTAYTYNDLNQPISVTIDYGEGISNTTVTTYLNEITEAKNIQNLPTSTTQVSRRDGESWERRTEINYSSNYQPTSKRELVQGNQTMETRFSYDTFGNPTRLTTRAYSSADSLTTTYTYSANGRFLTEEVDPTGQRISYTYSDAAGYPTSTVDVRGNKTTFDRYDAFGRLLQYTSPTGVVSETTYAWEVSEPYLYRITQATPGEPTSSTWFDGLGRACVSSIQGFDGQLIHTTTLYDQLGRAFKVSAPYKGTTPTRWTETKYDAYERPTTVSTPEQTTTYGYSGRSVTTTDANGSITKAYNSLGELISVKDVQETISYLYRADGQVSSVNLASGGKQQLKYDKFGRREELTDPSAQTIRYEYDDSGNLSKLTNGRSQVTTYQYNRYGQLRLKQSSEMTTVYTYHEKDNSLQSIDNSNGVKETFKFNQLGQLESKTETVNNRSVTTNFAYNLNGKLESERYSPMEGKLLTFAYNNYGYLQTLSLGNMQLWKLEATNDYGQATQVRLGNGALQTFAFTASGLMQERRAVINGKNIQQYTYQYDEQKGLLTLRSAYEHKESFQYDQLKRLTHYGNHRVVYGIVGNIAQKTDAGNYVYGLSAAPYAISQLEKMAEDLPLREQQVAYSSDNRPMTIAEGVYKATFTYDEEGNRRRMTLTNDNIVQLNRYYYGGGYERDEQLGREVERIYLGGTAYNAPAVWLKENGQERLLYIHRDNLGSITEITNQEGQLVESVSYDAWGRQRNPYTWQTYEPGNEPILLLGRGYTGHEHLSWFGLINMNARLYDPVLGRFLSPDPLIQAPDFSQNFNRYTYCFNNPLGYTDINGEWVHLVLGAAVGGVLNWISHGAQFNTTGLAYFGMGAIAGAASAGMARGVNVAMAGGNFGAGFIGAKSAVGVASIGVTSGLATGVAGGVTSGLLLGAGNTWLAGGTFQESMKAGYKQALLQGAFGGFFGGITGGLKAYGKGINAFTGTMKNIDLSDGYGATGLKKALESLKETIKTAKFVTTFENKVDVYETAELGTGRGSAGICLPGKGIFIGRGTWSLKTYPELLHHEFGHYLQFERIGYKAYYAVIGLESAISAGGNGNHNVFWTETWANYLSSNYFGSRYYGSAEFPIQNIRWYNYIKILVFAPILTMPK